MKIVILGAGSGGFTAAVDLKLRGFDLSVCSTYPPDVAGRMRDVAERGGVDYSGVLGEGFLELETYRSLSPVKDADVVMVVTLAPGHHYYALRCARLIRKGAITFLNPGYLWGSLAFAKVLRDKAGASTTLAETNNLPYICRFVGATDIRVFRRSKLIFLSHFPSATGGGALDLVKELYPDAIEVPTVLETGMMNPNVMVHPPGMLLNAGWIEASKGDFLFYNVGCTDSVSRVIEALDAERLRLCKKLRVETMGIGEYYRRNGYSDSQTTRMRDILRDSEPNKGIKSPSSLDSRYITEDVPYGLVPMSQLGRLADVETPVADALIELASTAMGVDYSRAGLTLEKMGVNGMGVGDLRRFLRSGHHTS